MPSINKQEISLHTVVCHHILLQETRTIILSGVTIKDVSTVNVIFLLCLDTSDQRSKLDTGSLHVKLKILWLNSSLIKKGGGH